jgi:tRNA(fMet)-specific endonuclease VapC
VALVIDTSAYSAFLKADARVRTALQRAPDIYIPAVVLGEILFGFRKGSRFDENYQILRAFLGSVRVKPVAVDEQIADQYSQLRLQQEALGKILDSNDLWIATICQHLQLPLLTLDSDFKRVKGLQLVDLA